jgi:hypothetical protein
LVGGGRVFTVGAKDRIGGFEMADRKSGRIHQADRKHQDREMSRFLLVHFASSQHAKIFIVILLHNWQSGDQSDMERRRVTIRSAAWCTYLRGGNAIALTGSGCKTIRLPECGNGRFYPPTFAPLGANV